MSDVTENDEPGEQDELKDINIRRKALGLPDVKNADTVGLALSGGGIRSAVFSLGLIRALAKKGLLRKFDYLSTVSGGGYVGAMLGRLYEKNRNGIVIENALASDHTILLAWLRNNGRYLTPAGFTDTSLALTQIFRSFLASLFLVTLLCAVVASIAISLNTLLVLRPEWLETRPWLFALSVPLAFATWLGVSYWLIDHPDKVKNSLKYAFSVIAAGYAFLFWYVWYPSSLYTLSAIAAITLYNLYLIRKGLKHPENDLAKLRQRLTRTMAMSLGLALIIVTLWSIYGLGLFFSRGNILTNTLLPPTLLAVIKGIWEVKWVKKFFSKIETKLASVSLSLTQLANILGFVLLFFSLVTVCAAEIHFLRYYSLWSYAVLPLVIVLVIVLFFWVLCLPSRIINLLNLSSLYNFYRSRIERAWLSVANFGSGKYARFTLNPLTSTFTHKLNNIKKVTDPLPGDDMTFGDYHPHKFEGPIHLITCCINQTVDDRSRNYNADRKGIALTVSAFGAETGTQPARPSKNVADRTLSHWIAISGAAAATGMGSYTSPGLAFLLFLIGGRLGYWSPNLIHNTAKPDPLPALFAEMFAQFPGKRSQYWYLSDGGHFENTGVYPLLKRRVKTIVVADCGADPEFIFDDLENLVRKARIDYGISVLFSPAITGRRTSVAQLKKGEKHLPLIDARIYYPKTASEKAMLGRLIIVKPHLLNGMGLDTASYADRHPDFPQQTTGDQFFDEEQWEAYHQLGLQAGKAITQKMLP